MSDEISEIKYLDFEISVQQEAGDEYVVRARSGKGKAEIHFTNPFNEDKRKVIRSALTAAALRSASVERKTKMRGAALEARHLVFEIASARARVDDRVLDRNQVAFVSGSEDREMLGEVLTDEPA